VPENLPAYRSGRVALVGRPNVGKSTLLNVMTGENIAIVSPHPQTTRQRLLGVVTTKTSQIAFVDTPGLHHPKHKLGVRMQNEAKEGLRGADLVVFIADARTKPDSELIGELPKGAILALNKVDLVRPKSMLLPVLEAWDKAHAWAVIVPISAKTTSGVQRLLEEVRARLPEGEALYEADVLTDRPERFLVAEVVREQILLRTRREVPHGIAVTVDAFEETDETGAQRRARKKGRLGGEAPHTKRARVTLTVHVPKESHKKIIVGRAGSMLKEVGTAARLKLEKLLGKQLHLAIWVRVTPDWVDDPRALGEMGFE
jgi:GTPase